MIVLFPLPSGPRRTSLLSNAGGPPEPVPVPVLIGVDGAATAPAAPGEAMV